MTTVIVDTGPLVSYLNRKDRHHEAVKAAISGLNPPFFTCEAVVSETLFLLRGVRNSEEKLYSLLKEDFVRPSFDLIDEIDEVIGLLRRYRSVPMSFADACLVRMAELVDDSVVLTIDNDFQIYRKNRNEPIHLIFPEA